MQRELMDRSSRLQEEKDAADAKYQAKRSELKEVTLRLTEKTTTSEKEIAVLTQKFASLEEDNAKLVKTYEAEIEVLRKQADDMNKN